MVVDSLLQHAAHSTQHAAKVGACRFAGRLAGSLAAWCVLRAACCLSPAFADGGGLQGPTDGWRGWNWEPTLLLGLAAASWLYARGLLALWEKAGIGRGVSRTRAGAFEAGLATLFAALISPLDRMSAELSSAHMVQHMLLMLIAAPLLALGSPGFVFLWALPLRGRKLLGLWVRRVEAWYSPWYLLWQPVLSWSLYALALWIWHLPALYQAALRHRLVHESQHLAFLLTSCLFWRVLLDPLGRLKLSRGAGVLYLFATSLHASALGVFMALSPRLWYPAYAATAPAWHLTPLEDQQLAGLIMWMPACMLYAVAAAALFAAWLEEAAQSTKRKAQSGSAASPRSKRAEGARWL